MPRGLMTLLAGIAMLAGTEAFAIEPCPTGQHVYKIYRSLEVEKSKEIGSMTYECDNSEEGLTVKIRERIDAGVWFLGYELCSDREETWRSGRIESFAGDFNESGIGRGCSPYGNLPMPISIDVVRDDDGWSLRDGGKTVKIEGTEDCPVTPESQPANFWNARLIEQLPDGRVRIRAIDPVTAKAVCWHGPKGIAETLEVCRQKIPAVRYELEGEDTRTVWYDTRGRWLKLQMSDTCEGATILKQCPTAFRDDRGPAECPRS